MKYFFGVSFLLLLLLPVDLTIAQEASRFVTCNGTDCSACNLVGMINEIIIWLFGIIFLIFAAIMVVAGFGLVTSGGNQSALQAAKSKFTNAIIGVIIVMSAWILVDTVMRQLVTGGGNLGMAGFTGFGPWSEVECTQQARPGTYSLPVSTSTSSTGPVPVSEISARVLNAASVAFGTMSTASHQPGGGTLACAWAVNQILNNAGIASVNGDSVVSMRGVLDSGRGTAVSRDNAMPGDLVLVTGAQTSSSNNANHVGICMTRGCTQVYSNSSSRRSFSWQSGPTFSPSYSNAQPVFYRLNN